MRALRFLLRQFRQAPSKRRFLKSLALGNRGGNREVTSADGTKLSVRVSGDGPALVLVHGALDGMNSFAFVEPALAERMTVWTYDRRGRGGSGDGDSYALAREVDDLRAVMAATGETPHVLGHSYGGAIALLAALDGIEMRSLVVYEPPINVDAISPTTIDRIESLVMTDQRNEAIRTMAGRLAGVSDDELAIALTVPPVRKALRDGTRSIVRELRALQSLDWSALPVRGVDTLVLMGERRTSPAYPSDDQAAALAESAEVVVLSDQGHVAQSMAPQAFLDAVVPFLESH